MHGVQKMEGSSWSTFSECLIKMLGLLKRDTSMMISILGAFFKNGYTKLIKDCFNHTGCPKIRKWDGKKMEIMDMNELQKSPSQPRFAFVVIDKNPPNSHEHSFILCLGHVTVFETIFFCLVIVRLLGQGSTRRIAGKGSQDSYEPQASNEPPVGHCLCQEAPIRRHATVPCAETDGKVTSLDGDVG